MTLMNPSYMDPHAGDSQYVNVDRVLQIQLRDDLALTDAQRSVAIAEIQSRRETDGNFGGSLVGVGNSKVSTIPWNLCLPKGSPRVPDEDKILRKELRDMQKVAGIKFKTHGRAKATTQ